MPLPIQCAKFRRRAVEWECYDLSQNYFCTWEAFTRHKSNTSASEFPGQQVTGVLQRRNDEPQGGRTWHTQSLLIEWQATGHDAVKKKLVTTVSVAWNKEFNILLSVLQGSFCIWSLSSPLFYLLWRKEKPSSNLSVIYFPHKRFSFPDFPTIKKICGKLGFHAKLSTENSKNCKNQRHATQG